jgi:hypothetical protein
MALVAHLKPARNRLGGYVIEQHARHGDAPEPVEFGPVIDGR